MRATEERSEKMDEKEVEEHTAEQLSITQLDNGLNLLHHEDVG